MTNRFEGIVFTEDGKGFVTGRIGNYILIPDNTGGDTWVQKHILDGTLTTLDKEFFAELNARLAEFKSGQP